MCMGSSLTASGYVGIESGNLNRCDRRTRDGRADICEELAMGGRKVPSYSVVGN